MAATLLGDAEALRTRGALAEARRCCEEFLSQFPGHAAALELMAALAADEGHTAAALDWARRAALADAQSAAPHYTMGRAHQAEGRLDEAEASYRRSLALDEAQPKAHNNLGCVLQMLGRLGDAIESFRRALSLEPALAQARQNLGVLMGDRAAFEEAAAGYRRLAASDQGDAEVRNNLGNVYRELGFLDQALASFDEAIRRNPSYPEARFSRAQLLLLRGDWHEGWREHEWRWKVKGLGTPPRGFAQPEWDGRDLGAGTLLLHAEQGLGDAIQFIRYAPQAAMRCRSLVVECQPPLAGLFRSAVGVSRVVSRGEQLPPFDAHLPLMSLPRLFDVTPNNILCNGPYLHADPRRVDAWKRERIAGARHHVGIAWAGRPQYWDDRKRSIALAALEPLARVAGVALYSLQWGEATAQLASLPAGMRIADFGDRIGDYSEMAALAAALDLVVSVDTSVIHLAGAMGVPAWLMLARAPDWRWLLERDDSPWYPSVRIFRQQEEGRWEGVIGRIAAELQAVA